MRKRIDVFATVRMHQLMIQDRLRTLSYKKAIERTVKPGDVVLDLGCGTGILSFFAARAGCKKIYAIEKESIIDDAAEAARRNGLDAKIKFVKQDVRLFQPSEPIDVLIHEQIGAYLWNEGMVAKVACVRDRFLRRGGVILPFKVDLYLAPVSYVSPLEECMAFWRRRHYGIDFSNLGGTMFKQNVLKAAEPSMANIHNSKSFLCREKLACSVDLRTEKRIPKKITVSFQLPKRSKLRGMCGFFRIHLTEGLSFTTRPRRVNTSWGQIFMPCFEERVIRRDSTLNFVLFPKRNPRKWRYEFTIV